MMMKSSVIIEKLDKMIPNPRCELEYSKDYELLIATVLSAQCKDARVNEVTKVLFNKYDIFSLQNADINDIMNIIKPVGTFRKKSAYIIAIGRRSPWRFYRRLAWRLRVVSVACLWQIIWYNLAFYIRPWHNCFSICLKYKAYNSRSSRIFYSRFNI